MIRRRLATGLGTMVAAFVATSAVLAGTVLAYLDPPEPAPATWADDAARRYIWLTTYGHAHDCSVDGFGPDGPFAQTAAVEGVDGVIRLEPFDVAWADYLAGDPDGETLIAVCLEPIERTTP
jgi:hypothetical protein